MEGEEMDSPGKVLKMLNSPFSKERDFWSFLYLFGYAFFSLFLLLCSISLLRMNSGIFEIFEDKTIFSNFLSNGLEVATPRFVKLGELWKIYRRWIYTSEWTYARQQRSFWVRLEAKFHEGKSF
jgi:hypothetical protein